MEAVQRFNTAANRRSDRVSIAFPVEVSGVDFSGNPFRETTKTSTVSRYGCCVSLPQLVPPGQEVHVRRPVSQEQVVGRVVAEMGSLVDGHLYGISILKSCEDLWGIHFSLFSIQEKLLDSMYEGVYFVNRERRITYWNQGAERLAGFSASDAVGELCSNGMMIHVDESGKPLCNRGCPLTSVMADGQSRQAAVYLRHKDGHRVPVGVRVMPMRNSAGTIVGAAEVFSERTVTIGSEQRIHALEKLAFNDSLTNLPNRRYMEFKISQALLDHQEFGRQYGLLMFDLDRFKQINDTHTHEVGDALLKAIAETLLRNLRPVEVIARWGGEEFVALMADVEAIALGDLAERCRVLIAQSSVPSGETRASVTASIGATMLSHTDSALSSIRRADELMYESKRSGGDRTSAG